MADPFSHIIERARAGDRVAVESLLVPQLPALTAFVRLRVDGALARRESSADIVQSICREAIGDIAAMRGGDESAFRSWLYGIAANKIANKADFHRAARRDIDRVRDLDSRLDDDRVAAAYEVLGTPSRELVAAERLQCIEAAFDELPEDYRSVLLHVCIAGASYAEAASLMGKSTDSVRKLLHRARARLASLLAKNT